MKWFLTHKKALVVAIAFMLIGQTIPTATAYVPVRISIKFILDAGGNRPANGNLNTDEEILAEVEWASIILADNISELRVEQVEFVDLAGVSQYYDSDANGADRDKLRVDAINDPATYRWRNDAINIYINGGDESAISKFPPDNDIILMNQWCGATPSCVLHELGHSLNLAHTHAGGGADGCADTIQDNDVWTRDQIAQNNFGDVYANLTAAQQDQVDLVFNNVMSYHTSEPQIRLSTCQMNRASTQADSDRGWLLAREPVYVNSVHTGSESGRFTSPYKTLQSAINAGLSGKVAVLQQGGYTAPAGPISVSCRMVTRSGPSTVSRGCLLYSLPVDLEKSKNPEVSNAIKAVRSEDTTARQVMKDAKAAVETAVTAEKKSLIMEDAEAARRLHGDNAVDQLLYAEAFADGKEKVAIQLELAQRYKYSENYTEAVGFFILVADNTKQKHLRERALYEADNCRKMIEKSQEAAVSEQHEENIIEPVELAEEEQIEEE